MEMSIIAYIMSFQGVESIKISSKNVKIFITESKKLRLYQFV